MRLWRGLGWLRIGSNGKICKQNRSLGCLKESRESLEQCIISPKEESVFSGKEMQNVRMNLPLSSKKT
jgi:hypothetical protein